MLAIAKAKQHPLRDAAVGELAAQQGQGRDADATADENCAGSAGCKLRDRRERPPQGPGEVQRVAGAKLAQAICARSHLLEQKVESHSIGFGRRVGDRECARQVGPAPGTAPGVGGEHVELPRARQRALGVERGDDPVAARRRVRNDPASAAPEGRLHPLAHRSASTCCPRDAATAADAGGAEIPCNSCSETGSAGP